MASWVAEKSFIEIKNAEGYIYVKTSFVGDIEEKQDSLSHFIFSKFLYL